MNKIGIDAISYYVPSIYLSIEQLSKKRNLDFQKLNKGLGLEKMAIADSNEDPSSFAANALIDLFEKNNLDPQQMAVFEFKPTIWIGVVSQVEEGEVMNSAIISDINTELGLLGVASADIVMTGGGSGPNASAFEFHLQNIVSV